MLYFYYRIIFISFILYSINLFAPPKNFTGGENDFLSSQIELKTPEEDRVQILSAVLSEKGSKYSLQLLEAFEGERLWSFHRNIAFLRKMNFISKIPESKAFQLESEIFKKNTGYSYRSSFMLHSYFEVPSRESIFFKPESAIRFEKGLPVKIFGWVFSNEYDISLELVLSQKFHQNIHISLGKLSFKGWKRIETVVQLDKKSKLLIERKGLYPEVKGFLLKPGKQQKKGAFFIYLDQFSVLLDKAYMNYPGSEIRDNWR